VLARPDTIIFLFYKKTYIPIYNLYSILKTSYHDVLLVRQFHPLSPALLPSGHGFESHLLHRFLTFYADLIKWVDGLTGWPDTVSRPTWRACAIVVARVGRRYTDLIKWIDELTDWPDTVSRPTWRACAIVVPHVGRRYADLIKWINRLTGLPDTVSRPAWRACAIVVARVHLAYVGRRLTSIAYNRLIWNSCEGLFVKNDAWRLLKLVL
jgi:hypothetical protein